MATLWKLSMGRGASGGEFPNVGAVRQWVDQGVVLVRGPTGRIRPSLVGQGVEFRQARVGDLFYLCHGNDEPGILLLGELIGPAVLTRVPGGRPRWYGREFRLIMNARVDHKYQGPHRVWSPRGVSTFVPIPEGAYPEFESSILDPYFGMTTNQLLSESTHG